MTCCRRVKVLDFGLAKAIDPAGASSADAMTPPTLTARATQMGTIIGTAAYMTPEQAKGRPVDARADIWAFGVVCFEMLTGKPLFAGETISETVAAVLRDEIDWTALPATAPDRIRRLLARCLHRDVKPRLQAIGEARIVRFDGCVDRSSPLERPKPGTAVLGLSLVIGYFLHADRIRADQDPDSYLVA